MAFCVFFFASVFISGIAGAPSGYTGKEPIDPECTLSPVVSLDSFNCARFAKSPDPAPEDHKAVLFEGDIAGVLEPGYTVADLDNKLDKAAIFASKRRWWGGQINYVISSSFTAEEQTIIWQAMQEFQDKTDSIKFFPRASHADYIYIHKGTGCSSYVGRQGGAQYLSLGSGCVHVGTVIHELNHAIGFWHEQSRSDRDSYVEINLSNIPTVNEHNFLKYHASQIVLSGTGYDFGSIMHYGKYSFANNPSVWTIRPKAPWQDVAIGQRNGLSATDVQEINAIYPLCATMWYEPNYTGTKFTFVSGQTGNFHANDQDKLSSAKVTFGCTLTTYSRVNFRGTSTRFRPTQPGYVYWNFAGYSWDNDARSFKCKCP